MGKPIAVTSLGVVKEVAVFDTDRSITGQDGIGFASAAEVADLASFPARLAQRLFEAVPGLAHVFVASSQVVLRRSGGWDDSARSAAEAAIAEFFVF
ncbi:MAG: hypothetical protein HZA58_07270 [Acidimicrobiia bacterium]|nr:hypothetical protein [Acidimicrobiia bacterium]